MKVFGIDISSYQKGISFSSLKEAGVKYVILRAGYTGSMDGISKKVDSCFEDHYQKAKNEKIGVGAYWFSRATNYQDGKKEAEYMYEHCLKNKTFEYPIAIDVEDEVYQSTKDPSAITEAIRGFCEYLEQKNFYVSIYANRNWFQNHIDTSKLKQYDKWVASWGKKKPANPTPGIWQFGGETNYIRSNQIAGYVVDQDYAYYDYPSIMQKKGLNGFSKEEEIVKEVIEGKWGNGEDRKKRLTDAGYNYSSIQKKVNELLNEKTYIVQKGDTLSKIAKRYGISWRALYQKNKDIIGDNPNKIYAGQVLKI